jgi:predicted extracellular nuclease
MVKRYGVRFAGVLALLTIIGCAPGNRAELRPLATKNIWSDAGRTLRIGAWNIQWLGLKDERSGRAKGIEQAPEDLADYIVASGVRVLALAEIANFGSDGASSNPILDRTLALVSEKTGGRWEYRLFAARSRNQNVGVAWDATRVQLIGPPQVLSDGAAAKSAWGSLYWNRPAVAVRFSTGDGQTDFDIVPLHMKSNSKPQGSDEDLVAHREREATMLIEALQARGGDERDVILIGDTNCLDDQEPALKLLASAGWVDLNAADLRTTAGGSAAPFDRAIVPADQPEFADRRFEVPDKSYRDSRRISPNDFARRFSDHYMAITEIRIGTDDD